MREENGEEREGKEEKEDKSEGKKKREKKTTSGRVEEDQMQSTERWQGSCR